jgi:hypothetical protein
MGAKTNNFENYLTDVNKNFLSVEENKLTITHLWVDGFGWENTILIEDDFKLLEKLEGVFEGDNIMVGIEKEGFNYRIVKTS